MHATAAAQPARQRKMLFVASDEQLRQTAPERLGSAFQVTALDSAVQMLTGAGEQELDAVLLVVAASDPAPEPTLALLHDLRKLHPELVLGVVGPAGGTRLRRKALLAGVDEYFTSPSPYHEIALVMSRAVERKRAVREAASAPDAETPEAQLTFCDLIGGSEAMRRVYKSILRVAESNSTVLIRGESGTGKELVARSIVAMSPRRNKPFISLNCAALPEHLIEDELFGHEKGAFTGAHAGRAGHMELAHEGTLFLDEIATLSLHLQTKLLRVLEDRAVQRLGGSTPKRIDFRLLTATNDNLEQMVREGKFREDLYYRIHVVPISLPPLRERAGDIALLADHYVRYYCAQNRIPLKRIDVEALDVLEEYSWPGNVRELQNLMQRLVLMVDGPTILASHLPQQILFSTAARSEALLIPEGGIDFSQELLRIEAAYVHAALRRARGSKTQAAALLRINLQQMKYLCRKHHIKSVEAFRGEKTTSVKNSPLQD